MHIKRDRLRRRRTHQKPKSWLTEARGKAKIHPRQTRKMPAWRAISGGPSEATSRWRQQVNYGDGRRGLGCRAAGTSRSANEIAGVNKHEQRGDLPARRRLL